MLYPPRVVMTIPSVTKTVFHDELGRITGRGVTVSKERKASGGIHENMIYNIRSPYTGVWARYIEMCAQKHGRTHT